MLKIKDDVDLKELEKFGFVDECEGIYHLGLGYLDYWINSWRCIEVLVYDNEEVVLDNTLYDLIKADMVEKVEE